MSLEPGVRLGVYEILAPIGAGGMGEVYRAKDTRLGRDAAVKILPVELAQQADRLARFEQEARAASSLNHPHIVTIYEIGFEGGTPFLAMELVDGKTLRDLMVAGALPVRRVLAIGAQIAEGLQKAHAAGIVHRDLKPENVMVSKDGFVKILDFGLAKLTRPESGVDTAMPTMGGPKTASGVVMGTVDYMSPEQASGEPVDFRSDQFSFGSILYEMATGTQAFHRKTAAETMSAIIREEPRPFIELRKDTPPPLRWIVERCLAKEPDDRYASTRDLAKDLASVRDHVSEISTVSTLVSAPAGRVSRLRLPALALGLLALGAAGGRVLFRSRPAAPPSFHRLTYQEGTLTNARFSADGATVVHGRSTGTAQDLYQIRVGSPEVRRLDIGTADILAISASGEMAVKLGAGPFGTLARTPLLGGAPRPVAEAVSWAGADFAPDGKELVIVRRDGDTSSLEYPIGKRLADGVALGCPRFSPRGDRIAFVDSGRVVVIGTDGRGKRTLCEAPPTATCPIAWRADGDEVWYGAQTPGKPLALFAVDLAARSRLVARVPGSLELFDIARDGRVLLAHHTITRIVRAVFPGSEDERDYAWLDGTTPAQLSADAALLLFTEEGEGSPDGPSVYLRRTDGSPAVRLGDGSALALSPDQQWVLARVNGSPPLVLLPTGAGQPRSLPDAGFESISGGEFLPDGRGVVFSARQKDGASHVYLQSLEGGPPRAITPPGASFSAIVRRPVSPDGRLLYATRERVPAFHPLDGGAPRPISGIGIADYPVQWSADGRRLYVMSRADRGGLWTVDPGTGDKRLVRRFDMGGFGPVYAAFTADARYYAVGRDIVSSGLYVVDGLR